MSGDFEQAKSRVCQFEGAYVTVRPLASSWEQRKFSEIVDVCSGRDYKHLDKGPIPVYGTGGYMTSVCEALSHDRDAVGIGRKGTIDKPYLLKAPFWTVDTLFYAIPRQDINLEFVLCSFLNVDWKSKDESTGLPSLSKEAINETVLSVPDAAEQNHLGGFFTDLDVLITLHQRMCPIFCFCAHESITVFASTLQGWLRALRYPRPIPKMLVSPSEPASGVFGTAEGTFICASSSTGASTSSPSAR